MSLTVEQLKNLVGLASRAPLSNLAEAKLAVTITEAAAALVTSAEAEGHMDITSVPYADDIPF